MDWDEVSNQLTQHERESLMRFGFYSYFGDVADVYFEPLNLEGEIEPTETWLCDLCQKTVDVDTAWWAPVIEKAACQQCVTFEGITGFTTEGAAQLLTIASRFKWATRAK